MTLNPASQYADDRNLGARQRLWQYQQPPFDLVAWTLDLADIGPGQSVLDLGCGNGAYLRALAARDILVCGGDLSLGMLRAAGSHRLLCNGDAMALPFHADAFDVVLAPHMLYHVPDREAAAREMRRVLRDGGVCVAVTNGAAHTRSMRALVERAARVTNPEWEMSNPSTHAFSLENGAAQLAVAFASVDCVRVEGAAPVVVRDADLVADYVASTGDHYEHEIDRPWSEVVDDVRAAVQQVIDAEGSFTIKGETGAFVCR
ncbi:MAG TPA: class I SAM-dependent methyltransferase [Acidimicrobiia bacterium]|jgi:SAM-dependent methyltransferase